MPSTSGADLRATLRDSGLDDAYNNMRSSTMGDYRPSSVGGTRRLSFAQKVDNAHVKNWQTYTRVMLVICAFFYVLDNVLDFIVAFELIERQHEYWGFLMGFFIFLPIVLLVLVNTQLGRYKHALAALVGVSILLEMRESWILGVDTRDLIRETDVHMIFQTIPQFLIQSQLILQNHYLSKRCEETFDMVCTKQCSRVPDMKAPFSRFTCMRQKEGESQDKCWADYAACIETCPGLELLNKKISMEQKYVSAWMSLKPGAIIDASKKKRRASEAFQVAMLEDSKEWNIAYCDAQASGITEVVNTGTGKPIKTLMRSVSLLWMQLPALISSALTIALSRSFRTVDERSDYNISTGTWVIQLMSFGFHFLFDMFASSGSISLYWAATAEAPHLRAIMVIGLLVTFQAMVRIADIYPHAHWTRRFLAGLSYALMSPLARLPACKPLRARQIRTLLRLRVFVQIVLSFVGFYRMSGSEDAENFHKELALAIIMILLAIIFTNTPGTRAVWTSEWDTVTRRYLMAKDLIKFDNRLKFRMLRQWKAFVKGEHFLRQWEEKMGADLGIDITEHKYDPDSEEWLTLPDLIEKYSGVASISDIFLHWELECKGEHDGQGTFLNWMEEDKYHVMEPDAPPQDSANMSLSMSMGFMMPTASKVSKNK